MKDSILVQFLRKPLTTGAICPSSHELSRTLTECIHIDEALNIAELGPGTGAITEAIIKAMNPHANFFAVELNDAVIPAFKRRFPKVKLYNDSAANLKQIMQKESIRKVDVILSGLPWASFPDHLQEEILAAILEALPDGGYFTTFAYLQGTWLPTGIKFKHRLEKYFSHVEKSKIVWCNIPPAFAYRCRK